MKTQGRCVDNMAIKSPAAMKVAFGENPKTIYGNQNILPSTRMGTAALLRKIIFEAIQYKRDKENGQLDKENFEMEPWIPVLNKEIPLKARAHRADDILTAIRIAKEFDLEITIDHPVALIQYLPICAGLAVREGLPMEAALKVITINAAKICRVDDRVGSLKTGKDADIAIFSGNPLETFTKTMYTIIDGQIIYENQHCS
jgi:imidazolonepropionase-like amidohydrolase